MTVLVVYASKHGATRQIAERIASTLTAAGAPATARATGDVVNVSVYDAYVIGAGAYYGRWFKPATEFVRARAAVLSTRAVWLFTSGPLGPAATESSGPEPQQADLPKEIEELREATGARGHRVFFGALNPDGLTLSERTLRRLPAGRALLPEGDFRDWADIDAWAVSIADELSGLHHADQEPVGHGPA